MQNIVKILLSFILFFSFHSILAGQIYKWVDENGKVHFGDRPKVDRQQEEVRLKPLNTVNQPNQRMQQQQKMLDSYQRRREDQAKAQEEQRKQQAKTKEQCDRAKSQLESYINSTAMYENLPNGERRYLDQKERDDTINKLKRDIAANCR